MDHSRFDQLTRRLGERCARRGVTALLAATGALPLLGPHGAEARKKEEVQGSEGQVREELPTGQRLLYGRELWWQRRLPERSMCMLLRIQAL